MVATKLKYETPRLHTLGTQPESFMAHASPAMRQAVMELQRGTLQQRRF
ncbi:hypothetical protein [Erythrobacter sp. R86502]